ncbi:hypothetical protein Tco_0304233 [Tanacetum coccineum]
MQCHQSFALPDEARFSFAYCDVQKKGCALGAVLLQERKLIFCISQLKIHEKETITTHDLGTWCSSVRSQDLRDLFIWKLSVNPWTGSRDKSPWILVTMLPKSSQGYDTILGDCGPITKLQSSHREMETTFGINYTFVPKGNGGQRHGIPVSKSCREDQSNSGNAAVDCANRTLEKGWLTICPLCRSPVCLGLMLEASVKISVQNYSETLMKSPDQAENAKPGSRDRQKKLH